MADLARHTDDREFRHTAGRSAAAYARVAAADGRAAAPHRRTDVSTAATSETAVGRITSLDALRGFAMFWILAGDHFAWALHDMAHGKEGPLAGAVQFVSEQFMHVDWEGLRFYDFLLPLFVFVIGVSIVFSLTRLVEREGPWIAHRRVLMRSALLFALGVIYYGGAGNHWPDVRLLGVLQRLALCYLFASLLFLHLRPRGLVIACLALLVGYWGLMTFVPVPGVGAGSYAKGANLAHWVDAQVLPGLRLYGDWDPEGLLSTLPAVASCLLGVLAGLLLKTPRLDPVQKAQWLLGAGVALVVLGHLWGLQFPIIKNIWTSSFVLVTGGYSLLLLGLFYAVIDVQGRKAWSTMFVWIGANAILLYMLNNLIEYQAIARKLVGGDIQTFFDTHLTYGAGSFVRVAVALTIVVALARWLYQRKIFVRV